MQPRIAYVTYSGPVPDPDLPLALAALHHARLDAEAVVWDEAVAWADFDLVVVRSVWDYFSRRQDFLRWARAVEQGTLLANPARTLVKNTDKTYLRDLARSGVPTVQTVWFEPGDSVQECAGRLRQTGWTRLVVKPNIDTVALNAIRVADADEAARAAAQMASVGRVALIQPYLPVVERAAEVSVVVLGGQISHAVSRRPALTSGGDSGAISPVIIDEPLAEAVHAVMDVASDGEDLLYARVDLVPEDDQWLLMEFEATEPRLFLDTDPQAPARFAQAVRRAISPDARQAGPSD